MILVLILYFLLKIYLPQLYKNTTKFSLLLFFWRQVNGFNAKKLYLNYISIYVCILNFFFFLFQFPKCYKNLKENDQAGLEILLCKIRKHIICEASNVSVKAMLVQIFENILRDFEPLNESAKNLYESLSKPIRSICE